MSGRRSRVALLALTCVGAAFQSLPVQAAPRAAKGPYLTGLSDTGVEVRFELDAPGSASVEVRSDGVDAGRAGARFESREASTMHVVRASGLRPLARYAYVVRAGGAAVGHGTFVTAPRDDAAAPLTFLVYGDDRSNHAAHAAVVQAMREVPSDFLIHTGDLVAAGGSAEEWQTFFEIEAPLLRERSLFAALGNHELYDDSAGASFARYFGWSPEAGAAPRVYGTARVGSVRLFWINGMHAWDSGEERAWLEGELARADAEPGLVWRIVVVHHSPWSSGPHGPNERLVDGRVPELLAAHHVQLLLAGHDHLYERGDAGAIKYVISGGAGAPLYRMGQPMATTRRLETAYHFVEAHVSGDALQIVAHGVDGTIIERCGLHVGGPWDCDAAGAGPAPASAAPATAAAAPQTSRATIPRCACDVPGVASGGAGLTLLLGAAAAASLARRRCRRG